MSSDGFEYVNLDMQAADRQPPAPLLDEKDEDNPDPANLHTQDSSSPVKPAAKKAKIGKEHAAGRVGRNSHGGKGKADAAPTLFVRSEGQNLGSPEFAMSRLGQQHTDIRSDDLSEIYTMQPQAHAFHKRSRPMYSTSATPSSQEKPKKKERIMSPTVSELEGNSVPPAVVVPNDDYMDVDDEASSEKSSDNEDAEGDSDEASSSDNEDAEGDSNEASSEKSSDNEDAEGDSDEASSEKSNDNVVLESAQERVRAIIARGHLRVHPEDFLASLSKTVGALGTSVYEDSLLFDASRGFSSSSGISLQSLLPAQVRSNWRSNIESWLACPDALGDVVDEPQYPDGYECEATQDYIVWNRDIYENLDSFDNNPGTTLAVQALKNILDISYVFAINGLDETGRLRAMQVETSSTVQYFMAAERVYRLYQKFGPQVVLQKNVSRSGLSRVTNEFDAVLEQMPAMASDKWVRARFYSINKAAVLGILDGTCERVSSFASDTFERIPCWLGAV